MPAIDYSFYMLVVLTGVYRALINSYMEPVYGTSILRYHEKWHLDPWTYLIVNCLFQYNVLQQHVSTSSSRPRLLKIIAVILGCYATCANTFHFSLLRELGPVQAPVLTVMPVRYGMTIATLILTMTDQTTIDAADSHSRARRPVSQRSLMSPWKLLLFCYTWIVGFEYVTSMFLTRLAAITYGRHFVGAFLSCILTLLAPWAAWPLCIPLVLLSFNNSHVLGPSGTAQLNQFLQPEGYEIIDRQESITGYLSVIDNLKDGYRVLRCDHSLLGGEWTRYQDGHSRVLNEPIYAIFVILEAVRLIEPEPNGVAPLRGNGQQHALFIGLGIGTSPAAFITHGITTTIVEIDPIVHQFASQYFNLPQNHTSITADAIEFVDRAKSSDAGKYQYIIHDVFTGGAEPIELFTKDLLEGLESLLDDDGAIAINYAGDLLLPSASAVVKTALTVFPACRLFRETAPPSSKLTEDLTNMVIFCRKIPGQFNFREPVEADFLGSHARREYLLPRHEIQTKRFLESDARMIEKSTMGKLKGAQRSSKISHWYLMRKVLPAVVWENW